MLTIEKGKDAQKIFKKKFKNFVIFHLAAVLPHQIIVQVQPPLFLRGNEAHKFAASDLAEHVVTWVFVQGGHWKLEKSGSKKPEIFSDSKI